MVVVVVSGGGGSGGGDGVHNYFADSCRPLPGAAWESKCRGEWVMAVAHKEKRRATRL